ncbi:MAG TPA: hypothetical protein VLM39_09800 [Ignavibacteriaceae bacterium]|nr:hypothetical protein [Ignavibacteriaceae bacterium]
MALILGETGGSDSLKIREGRKMKYLIIITFILFSISAGIAQTKTEEKKKTVTTSEGDTVITESEIISTEEDITPRSEMIVINPLKFLLFYNISYFHKFSDKTAFGIGVQMPTLSDVYGFGVNAEVRIYPRGKNLKGFYFAPNFSYNHLESGSDETSPIALGILVGWQWFPGTDFAMGLGIGIDYYFSVSDNDDFDSYDGAAPALRFDIGYAW